MFWINSKGRAVTAQRMTVKVDHDKWRNNDWIAQLWQPPRSLAWLGCRLFWMERFIEKETFIDDYMGAIDSVEESWPFLKQLLEIPLERDELQQKFDS